MKRIIEVSTLIAALMLVIVRGAALEEGNALRYQELTGELRVQLTLVQPDTNVLIAENNLVPYRFQITPDTRITIGNQKATLEDLAERRGQPVTIRYRSTRNGNIASQISLL
ncbi:MAG: hypothetical protein HY649_09755 [Acidobacteria bacterium]|nr:hypothetical protein [Acidobacteriota bacterium]